MAITNFTETDWSKLLTKLCTERIAYQDCISYVGEYKAGTVIFPGVEDISSVDYTKNGTLTYDVLTDTQVTLTMDQQRSISKRLDLIDKNQTKSNIWTPVLERVAEAFKNDIECYLGEIGAAGAGITDATKFGTTASPLTINTSDLALEFIDDAVEELDLASAGKRRWAVVPAKFKRLLVSGLRALKTDNTDIVTKGELASGRYDSGYFGTYNNVDLYWSNNIPNTTGTLNKILVGDQDCIRFAKNLEDLHLGRLETTHGEGVKALMVYGACVSRASTLICGTVNFS